jgi:hypothetical protein
MPTSAPGAGAAATSIVRDPDIPAATAAASVAASVVPRVGAIAAAASAPAMIRGGAPGAASTTRS